MPETTWNRFSVRLRRGGRSGRAGNRDCPLSRREKRKSLLTARASNVKIGSREPVRRLRVFSWAAGSSLPRRPGDRQPGLLSLSTLYIPNGQEFWTREPFRRRFAPGLRLLRRAGKGGLAG